MLRRARRVFLDLCLSCVSPPDGALPATEYASSIALKDPGLSSLEDEQVPEEPKPMHPALGVYDIVATIAWFLEQSDAVALARASRVTFLPAIPRVWTHLPSIRPLVNILPHGVQDVSLFALVQRIVGR